MRRLPIYILIDTSGSMRGEPIESVNVGLASMLASLRQEPYALETAWMSIITFDREVNCVLPLTPIADIQLPVITTPDSGPTHTGAALKMLLEQMEKEVQVSTPERKGDWRPILFLLTDGKPSDLQEYNRMVEEIKKYRFGSIVACAAGMKANPEPLKLLTDSVYRLDTLDSATFRSFFSWVTDSINVGNRTIAATDELELPPPPEEVNLIV